MGFLDNSGDIILDVVLTDHGRMLLAKVTDPFRLQSLRLVTKRSTILYIIRTTQVAQLIMI